MIELYTDGSAGPTNPGPGGWSVVSATEPLVLGFAPHTTNIRMEGIALVEALRWLQGRQAVIHTDSQLWVNTAHQWAPRWEECGWLKPNGETPANLDIAQPLLHLLRGSSATLKWVRGHNGNAGNNLADLWANRARLEMLVRGQHR